MLNLKAIGTACAAVGVVVLTPMAAYADCGSCYSGCIDAYGDDNSESGYHQLSQCLNSCLDDLGHPCMGTIGG